MLTTFQECKLLILKVVLSVFKKVNEGPLKVMKNAFYFMLKARFSFLKYLHFCPDFLIMQKSDFIGKPLSISKSMTSQIEQKIIIICALLSIHRSKGHETMKMVN